jgi:hypothetical protein
VPAVAEAKAPARPASSRLPAGELGLPETFDAISSYLSTAYTGVSKKTIDTLLDRFGSGVFDAMQNRPMAVRVALDERRAGSLLEQWADDYAKRSAALAPAVSTPVTAPAVSAPAAPASAPAGATAPAGGHTPVSRPAVAKKRGRGGRRPSSAQVTESSPKEAKKDGAKEAPKAAVAKTAAKPAPKAAPKAAPRATGGAAGAEAVHPAAGKPRGSRRGAGGRRPTKDTPS